MTVMQISDEDILAGNVSDEQISALEREVIREFFARVRTEGKAVVFETDINRYLDLKNSGSIFDPAGDYVLLAGANNEILDITPVVYHAMGSDSARVYAKLVLASSAPRGPALVLEESQLDYIARAGSGYLLGAMNGAEIVAGEVCAVRDAVGIFSADVIRASIAQSLCEGRVVVPFARCDDVSGAHGEAYALLLGAKRAGVQKIPVYGLLAPAPRFYALVENSSGAQVVDVAIKLRGGNEK